MFDCTARRASRSLCYCSNIVVVNASNDASKEDRKRCRLLSSYWIGAASAAARDRCFGQTLSWKKSLSQMIHPSPQRTCLRALPTQRLFFEHCWAQKRARKMPSVLVWFICFVGQNGHKEGRFLGPFLSPHGRSKTLSPQSFGAPAFCRSSSVV